MSNFTTFCESFKGDIVTPHHPDYAQAIARWALNAKRDAKIVVFVKDAQDAALAIKYAKDNGLPMAIRGGGHSPAGFSSCEGGLVIDLSRYLNGVQIDKENQLATVGGGAIWGTVDKAAIKHSLATVGGTNNSIGVGGSTLGGGYGWLSGAHGLALDNLVQATVVVANGSIISANETENSDLFWAIRGGGSNFGVCTELVLKLHPQSQRVFAGTATFPAEMLEKIVSLTNEWWTKGPSENEGMVHTITRGVDGRPTILVTFFYNGSEAEGRANYRAFFDLKPTEDKTAEIPYEQLNTLLNGLAPHNRGAFMDGLHQTKPHLDSIREGFAKALQLSENNEFSIALVFDYFPLAKINSVPNGRTAFRRTSGSNVLILSTWVNDTPENLDYGRNAVQEISSIISKGQAEISESENVGFGYGNYKCDVTNNKSKVLFGDNYEKLQDVKKEYDPDLVFSKWFVVTPAA